MTPDNDNRLAAIRMRRDNADFVSYGLRKIEPDGFLQYEEYNPQAGDDIDFLLSEVARLEGENAAKDRRITQLVGALYLTIPRSK